MVVQQPRPSLVSLGLAVQRTVLSRSDAACMPPGWFVVCDSFFVFATELLCSVPTHVPSFGYHHQAAQHAIESATTEARCAVPNGVGVVKVRRGERRFGRCPRVHHTSVKHLHK